MLISREPERALVDLRNLPQALLELLARLVLHASVLNVHHEAVFAVLACRPPEVVDIAVEGVSTLGLKSVSQTLLDLGFEDAESHAVDGVL